MSRTSSSRVEDSKESRTQELKAHDLLRSEARGRAIAAVGIGDVARVELDLVVAEAEVRSVVEDIIAGTGELCASTIDPEIIVVLEALRVRQEHDPDAEGIEAELGTHDLQCPTDGTTCMTLAELAGNHEDVVILLLLADGLEHPRCLGRQTEMLLINLALAVVVEPVVAGLLDQVEDLLNCFRVGLGDLLPPRNGEPSFGVRGKRSGGDLLVNGTELREELTQGRGLLGDALGLIVAREIAVA